MTLKATPAIALLILGWSVAAEQTWKVSDLVEARKASDFELSPDGRHCVWVQSIPDEKKDRTLAQIMLTRFQDGETIQLTRADHNHTPRWSQDGTHIAFLSTRKVPDKKEIGETQLWVFSLLGGEPWALTYTKSSIEDFRWTGKRRLLIAKQESPSQYLLKAKAAKDVSVVVDDQEHMRPIRLYSLSLDGATPDRITDNLDRIEGFFPLPDGSQIVSIHNRSVSYEYDQRIKPQLHLYRSSADSHLLSDQIIDLPPRVAPQRAVWNTKGDGFYLLGEYTSDPQYHMATVIRVYHYRLDQGRFEELDLGWDPGIFSGLEATSDGFLTLLSNGTNPKLAFYEGPDRAGKWKRSWVEGEHQGHIFDFTYSSGSGVVAYEHSTASQPTQWVHAQYERNKLKGPQVFTKLNPDLNKKTRARTESIRWVGAQNDEVEGMLHYPHNYQEGKRYPLVVMIHGGPASADLDQWSDRWAYPYNLISQRGAFILRPNYHGSSEYGLEWVESIANGKYYELEVADIESGVDHLIEEGLVDPDKLGAVGWSNGAILTIALTIHTTRYKVASAGAGDVDWTSDWGNCAFGAAFDNYYLGGTPWEKPDVYRDKSPFFQLERVETPTLIFFGEKATSVPTQQGWMHFRALQQLGKTDVRFLLFPEQGHGLEKLTFQTRKIEEELAWLDRYLFGTYDPKNESLKTDSLLARALTRQKTGSVEGLIGRAQSGVLVPEMVAKDKLMVAKFEVTRAQFREFDANYAIPAGSENYPAGGVSYAQAQAYCKWISEKTGQTYRLPTRKELAKAFKPAGNTLDHWAGYAPNPEDAAQLRQLATQLPEDTLVRPVGSFKPLDEDTPIYDLGGNVAEWVGSGELAGGSAMTAESERVSTQTVPEAFIGFRIVAEIPQGD